ncbi:MAG: hypothetical protein GX675_02635 [Erysipelotrichaceae bacterium]|nr:hypothetical protein [Erysipelotrichaceae bacterium]
MEFSELRKMYPTFIYHGYDIEENEESIKIIYNFEISGLSSFNPVWNIKKKDNKIYSELKIFKESVFSLGMVELISYWKITCSPTVIIKPSKLDKYQINWWKKQYFYGLGEFFYINNIKTNIIDFMNIESSNINIEGNIDNQEYIGNLIPVGGGKDSFVTLEILKDLYNVNDTYVINNVISAINASTAAGYENKLINVSRTLDKRMLELNKQGFLNGHTPFSALVAFSSILVSIIYGKKYICLSNEASANESTILDEEVNHQYSKSFEFEVDFNEYINKYITNEIKYFSLLRPLSELIITHIFSKLKKYHPIFRSCNVGSKQGIWCNHCAKCLFVYTMLSAYMYDDELVAIFGANILDDETMYPTLLELSGLKDNKPFECVGTREEVRVAITKAIKLRNGLKLPLLYDKYLKENNKVFIDYDIYEYFNDENLLPIEYLEILKNKIGEYKDVRKFSR